MTRVLHGIIARIRMYNMREGKRPWLPLKARGHVLLDRVYAGTAVVAAPRAPIQEGLTGIS